VGQEYFINSQELQDKVSSLLPSQGGAGAGFDLSASTQIIPIIDLTEQAEGSNVRQDLQTALSFNTVTPFFARNATVNVVINTGYYRVFGIMNGRGVGVTSFQLSDGATTKTLMAYVTTSVGNKDEFFDFIVFLPAGGSLIATSNSTDVDLQGVTRQIADINGNLTNP